MDCDWLIALVALGEVIALQHARYRVATGYLDESGGGHAAEPARIEIHACLPTIQDLEDLLLISLRIGFNLLSRQRRPCCVASGRIANHSSEVANQKRHFVPEGLELAHLVDQHRVAKVQIRSGRIESRLDSQRLTAL